jgi:hypothetical protein
VSFERNESHLVNDQHVDAIEAALVTPELLGVARLP